MSDSISKETVSLESTFRPLRIWPVVLLLGLMLATKFITTLIQDGPAYVWMIAAFGPLLCSLLILLWWLTFSRARWYERLGGFASLVLVFIITMMLVDPSMLGPATSVYTVPLGIGTFGICLVFARKWLSSRRTWFALTLTSLAFLSSTLFKSDGLWGSFAVGLDWRWNESAEDRVVRQASLEQSDAPSFSKEQMESFLASPEWPTMRGPNQDGIVQGVSINKDWNLNPPKQLWKIDVGPAWSSMVISGSLLFTQEQRGESECVVCYDTNTGKQTWIQETPSRFFEALGGLGPRATPTLSGDSLYTVGAAGIVQRLNAVDGTVVWQQDLRKLASREPPMWGFSSTPCVTDDAVMVYAGTEAKGIIALDIESGSEKWAAACGAESYASVQEVKLDGNTYLSILTSEGLQLYSPNDGKEVLNYEWKHNGYRALQTQVIDANKLLIPTGLGSGTRLVSVETKDGSLSANEIWTSRKMKPDFNDLVQHKGYLYGFDDNIFGCIDLEKGEKAWRSGRYGKGQVVCIADSDALIVQAETGEIILLEATPDERKELGRIEVMQGKSWNHPVVVGKRLFARTAEEMVCFELQ